jgi:hypothetical protein
LHTEGVQGNLYRKPGIYIINLKIFQSEGLKMVPKN